MNMATLDKEGAALTATRYEALAGLPFTAGYLAAKDTQTLLDELFFQAPCRPTSGRNRR